MRAPDRWPMRVAQGALLTTILAIGVGTSLWALQRQIRSTAHNYPKTPIEVSQSQVSLIETFPTPGQAATSRTAPRTTRVRYANRAGLAASVFVLSGDVLCANTASQPVEAFSLTVMVFDAFHQPLQSAGRPDALSIQEAIPAGGSRRIAWERSVRVPEEVYEVAVVVTRVRFADGTVWTAPEEELLDVF